MLDFLVEGKAKKPAVGKNVFSGIVQEIGIVKSIESKNGILEIFVSCNEVIKDLKIGSSVAVNGCCQTVIDITNSSFRIQATKETLQRTNFQNLVKGLKVNLEASLKLGDSIDGHLVSGHVDATGIVVDILSSGENKIIKIQFPGELDNYVVSKGSIAVNGVSLTIIDSKNSHFSFTLIPYTRDNTNLGLIKVGDLVNLEVDLIGRYLVNYLRNKSEKEKVEVEV